MLEITVRSNPEEYEGWYESYGYRGRSKEGERFLEFCAAINMILGNTFFKNRASHLVLVTYEFDSSKTHVSYCLERRNQRKSLKDIKLLPRSLLLKHKLLHKPLVYEFTIRKLKDTRRKLVSMRKTLRLHEDSVKSHLLIKRQINKYRASSQKDDSVEGYWNILKGALL